MNIRKLLLGVAPIVFATSAYAHPVTATGESAAAAEPKDEKTDAKPAKAAFSTGVAKGRDLLDTAISASTLTEDEIEKRAPRSVADLLRSIPGVRAEASSGEGNANISIRGLPISSTGAKFLQIQEDGLPILEYGDIAFATADTFLRPDLTLAQVEAIRGGSASTFASNSPGGVINFISNTGQVDGGAIEVTAGLDYDQQRVDFTYGAHISDSLRFNVGGFYRTGEGLRSTGFNSTRGGQVKLNVTKEFDGGYVRFYAKFLDDRTPVYDVMPLKVTGTNDNPKYDTLPNFDPRHDTLMSRYFQTALALDGRNQVTTIDIAAGQHAKEKAFGVETKFDLAGWTITDRFRFASLSNDYAGVSYGQFMPAAVIGAAFGGPGATIRYANGPQAGTTITNPTTLNGNGAAALLLYMNTPVHSVDNVTNDLRASRVWNVGSGDLTTTAGLYASHQTIKSDWLWSAVISDIAGGGESHLLNVYTAGGMPATTDGYFAYGSVTPTTFHRSQDVGYTTLAPFGSVNYHVGKLAIGASVRFDNVAARGTLIGAELGGGRVGVTARDMNGDGIITGGETRVSILPLSQPAPVDYDHSYVSYSAGINYRIAEDLAVFARYSRGGRSNADRILFSPAISTVDGHLVDKEAAMDEVRQAEGGVKFRKDNATLNVTAFLATAQDTNIDSTNGDIFSREYRAKGVELEASYAIGNFSLVGGATYTDAEITKDVAVPAQKGNVPNRQAKLIFQASPQYNGDLFSVGAVFIGTTESYARDINQLKVPGYITTNAFVQVRPVDGVTLSVNANNLFDVLAITAIDDPTIPAAGIAKAHVLNGRNVSASLRFDF